MILSFTKEAPPIKVMLANYYYEMGIKTHNNKTMIRMRNNNTKGNKNKRKQMIIKKHNDIFDLGGIISLNIILFLSIKYKMTHIITI
jgi:hypothetical protein